jgi:outer membrane immunogenic protein
MKKLSVFLLACFAFVPTASAADLGPYPRGRGSIKDEPPPSFERPALATWTGFYIGANAGYGWGKGKLEDDIGGIASVDTDGFVGGGTIGYNFQFAGNWVWGVEADIQYADMSGNGCGGPCVTDVNWFGTVRGRIGPTFDRLFIYATGGLAYGDVEARIQGAPGWDSSSTNVGWTVGGGIEYAIAPNWSAKLEYLHVDLGSTDKADLTGFKADTEFDVVRAGLNYRLSN